ncbi:MAG TPA: hypothetical protein VGF98_02075 [Candidatus Tumulicola sp.]|jgi:hypothetical protein
MGSLKLRSVIFSQFSGHLLSLAGGEDKVIVGFLDRLRNGWSFLAAVCGTTTILLGYPEMPPTFFKESADLRVAQYLVG